MADEAYCWHFAFDVRLERGVNIAVVVHLHVVKAFGFELFHQVFGKSQLLLVLGTLWLSSADCVSNFV